ncbi:inactive protein RESTRICTED TEV MOVEMENT 2 [Diospyros lotus]|uniref:inactive protein RESTRICTED TEV MOVEMENT 2 n=1 Tax=Diospyros lotus TaxID=55363 RepID=UPI00224FC0DC|nr:inactive protein RESTRICTED TEV MOVEMENT 2 [Diospyros lotus]
MPLFSGSRVRNFFWKSKRKPPMDQPNNAAAMVQTYEDFEPLCTWQREEAQETLIVHLPEFRKEQLKVHISNRGLMRITGERPIDKTRTSRFIKEIQISNDCDPTRIHAKLSRGLLHIGLPKKVLPAAGQKLPAPLAKQAPEKEQPRSSGPQQPEQGVKRPKVDDRVRAKHRMEVSEPKPGKRMVLVKAAAVLILLAIGAYAIFKLGTSEAGAGVCQSFS